MLFFSKMQATGNDFLLINYLDNKFQYSFKLLTQYLCDRHYGVGADGLLIIDKSEKANFMMRIFNQDGTEAEMCGNGIRCFAKYLYEKKMIDKDVFTIETKSGIKEVYLEIEGDTVVSVEVDMGEPILDFEKIPVFFDNTNKMEIEGLVVYPISMGNPHCVCIVDNLEKFDVKKYGSLIERYKYFPNKTNVEFVEIIDSQKIKLRVWERGVGETKSCGTGACASAVISNMYYSTDNEIFVELLGGNMKVRYNNQRVFLKGNAEFIFEGNIMI